MSIRKRISKALTKHKADDDAIARVLTDPRVQQALARAVDERVESILERAMKKAIRPLHRSGMGVFGEVPIEDLEYEEAEDLEGKMIDCSVCGRWREANCIMDKDAIDARRESSKPSTDFCWCGFRVDRIPSWP